MAKDLNISYLFDFYKEILSEKQKEIVDDYYNSDLSLSEIAEDKEMTRQGVRDHIKRCEAQLFEMEEKLGLYKRFLIVNETCQKIVELAKEIQENSTDNISSKSAETIIYYANKLSD